ncbi:MAG TPA: methionyl-tRNA formyltransferase [Candidatus Eisenbacteria bacterium]|nr:methionyl-tRNA formyltransferase [Candidatus Eisenbacteria bacterium]
MRLVYYGTPAAAVPPLEKLVTGGRAPLLVVTRADRPKGRGLATGCSAVHEAALAMDLPVATPRKAGAPEEIDRVRALEPDLLLVVAYGQILPRALLEVPKIGALNIHFSLLPLYRGASPVQAALLAGDPKTGVSAMWMTEGLDEGPVFEAIETPIEPFEDAGALGARLALLGADCLARALDRIERGEREGRPQDGARSTYAPKIAPDAGRLDLGLEAGEIERRVRAYTPDPGAFFDTPSGRLTLLGAQAAPEEPGAAPGTVLGIDRERGLRIALARGSVWIATLKPSGRRAMSGRDFANGARLRPGSSFLAAMSP